MGRFGNVIFEFTAAYGMKLAAKCNKIFMVDNGQSGRLKQFFPKLKDHINTVSAQPQGLVKVHELAPNKFHTKTRDEIIAATKDVYLHGFLG